MSKLAGGVGFQLPLEVDVLPLRQGGRYHSIRSFQEWTERFAGDLKAMTSDSVRDPYDMVKDLARQSREKICAVCRWHAWIPK